MFTKKHYKAIARLLNARIYELKNNDPVANVNRLYECGTLADRFTTLFTEDNCRFDRQKFEAEVFKLR